jgi:hypothetical protein
MLIPYRGGPLDGSCYRRPRGRPPLFLHDHGVRMGPYHGYRIFAGLPRRRVTSPQTGYAFWGLRNMYVHSSVWAQVTGGPAPI